MPAETPEEVGIAIEELREIERLAAELARLAGAEMVTGLGKLLAVRYKGEPDRDQLWRDPVSEVDSRVEELIRERVSKRYPSHDILGEESEVRPQLGSDFVWAVDPIDGTTNFINGFPSFAASIGVLHRGRPVAGAVWCASTHALRAGVYHAHLGGRFHFDDEALKRAHNPAVRRRLAGVPGVGVENLPWESRKTGSAAIECAFVAAGLLRVALFERPNVWDVAGGFALVAATGGDIRTLGPEGWVSFETFVGPAEEGGAPDLRRWHQPVIIGEAGSVAHWSKLRAEAVAAA
jgi:myo-inositol-1(or 4)-monophosphatase